MSTNVKNVPEALNTPLNARARRKLYRSENRVKSTVEEHNERQTQKEFSFDHTTKHDKRVETRRLEKVKQSQNGSFLHGRNNDEHKTIQNNKVDSKRDRVMKRCQADQLDKINVDTSKCKKTDVNSRTCVERNVEMSGNSIKFSTEATFDKDVNDEKRKMKITFEFL